MEAPLQVRERANVSFHAEPAGITSPGRQSAAAARRLAPAAILNLTQQHPSPPRHRPIAPRLRASLLRSPTWPRTMIWLRTRATTTLLPPRCAQHTTTPWTRPRSPRSARGGPSPNSATADRVADLQQEKVPQNARALRRADARKQHALQGGTQGHCPGPPPAGAK